MYTLEEQIQTLNSYTASSFDITVENMGDLSSHTISANGAQFSDFCAALLHYGKAIGGMAIDVTYDDTGAVSCINVPASTQAQLQLVDKADGTAFSILTNQTSVSLSSSPLMVPLPSDDRSAVIGNNTNPDGSLVADSLRLGDVQFFCAPTQIKVTNRFTGDKYPIIGGKTSMFSSTGHNEIQIEMTLYFNTLDQVNGTFYVAILPNGEEITYSINGLRALLSEFKHCPFLPVENDYLNNVCGISDVAMSQLSVSTVESFPGLFSVDLVLYSFDHLAYVPGVQSFAAGFNWQMFRWYYQLFLNENTAGTGTYLAPITSMDANFQFGLIDEQFLQQKKAATDYVNNHKEPDIYTFENLNTSLEQQGLSPLNYNEASLEDYFYLQDALNTYNTSIQPQLLLYQITGNPADDPANMGYNYWSASNGGCLIINIQSSVNWNMIENDFKDHVDDTNDNTWAQPGVITGAGVLWFKPPGMTGATIEDTQIINNITSNASIDKTTGAASTAISNAIYNNYTVYYDMLEQSQLEPEQIADFDDYPMDNVICTFMSATFQNILVPVQTQMCPTPTYQHLGSQDVILTMRLETLSESAAGQLLSMFQRATYLVREYKLYLDTGFLKLTNNVAQLFGVQYVVPIQISPSTTTETGHFAIELILMNYDRYERDLATAKLITTGHYLDMADPNHVEQSILYEQNVMNYLQFCEMRPDLELPTVSMATAAGYSVAKSSTGNYCEPDFYFVTSSTSLSDMVDEAFGYNLGCTYTDVYGGTMKVSTPKPGESIGSPQYGGTAPAMQTQAAAICQNYTGAFTQFYGDTSDIEGNSDISGSSLDTSSSDNNASQAIQSSTQTSVVKNSNWNPTTAGIASVFKTIGAKYVIPQGVLEAVAECESGQQQYRMYKGTKYPVCTQSNGLPLYSNDLASIKSCTGVGIMQVSCVAHANNLQTVNSIAFDINYNADAGAQILLASAQSLYKTQYVIPSQYDPAIGFWCAAYLGNYQGHQSSLFSNGADTQAQFNTAHQGSTYYEIFAKYCNNQTVNLPNTNGSSGSTGSTGSTSGSSSSTATSSPTEDDVDASTIYTAADAANGAPMPGDPGDLFYRSTEDMRTYDCRGRLVRAFPAFLMILIDEGTYINTYKLHDNFYSYYAINELHVNKSRKIAADTCTIKLINAFETLDTSPYDAYESTVDNWTAIVDSIKSLIVAPLAELERERNQTFDRLCLCTGARVHLRIGYGSDARNFPIQMNGCITEIGTGEVIDVIVQGDGMELTSKIPWNPGSKSSQGGILGQLLGVGDTPRHLLYTLLTLRGSWFASFLHLVEPKIYSFFYSQNPMGVAHFGDLGQDMLIWTNTAAEVNSEIMQNIYPGENLVFSGTSTNSNGQSATGETLTMSAPVVQSGTMVLSATLSGDPDISSLQGYGFKYNTTGPAQSDADIVVPSQNVSTRTSGPSVIIQASFAGYPTGATLYFYAWAQDATGTSIASGFQSWSSTGSSQPPAAASSVVPYTEGGKASVFSEAASNSGSSTAASNGTQQKFEISIFDKSIWDVAQINAAATPDFISAVHPFGFRSTLFFGKPYYDLTYDYEPFPAGAGSPAQATQLTMNAPVVNGNNLIVTAILSNDVTPILQANGYGFYYGPGPAAGNISTAVSGLSAVEGNTGDVIQGILDISAIGAGAIYLYAWVVDGSGNYIVSNIVPWLSTGPANEIVTGTVSTGSLGPLGAVIVGSQSSIASSTTTQVTGTGSDEQGTADSVSTSVAQQQANAMKIQVIPKVKPFRQYHIFSSYYDLINNQLIASENSMHSCVIGMYTTNNGTTDIPKTTSPVYLDCNIYPEKMKTDIVDTSIYSGATLFQGIPIAGWIIAGIDWLERIMGGASTWVANTVARTALKLDVQEMYQGQFVVFGDPTVKPYDAFYLLDTYNNMSGMAEVRSVTHHFTLSTGFITAIEPDVSVVMDDPYMGQSWGLFGNIACAAFLKLAAQGIAAIRGYAGMTPVMNMIMNAAGQGKDNLLKVLDTPIVQNSLSDEAKFALQNLSYGTNEFMSESALSDISSIVKTGMTVTEVEEGVVAGEMAAGPAGWIAAALEFVSLQILTATVGTIIDRWLANRMALKLTLLKKNGHEFAAGIDGHRGCVVGDAADAVTTLLQDSSWVRGIAELLGATNFPNEATYNPNLNVPPQDPTAAGDYYDDIQGSMKDLVAANQSGSGDNSGNTSNGTGSDGTDSGPRSHPANLQSLKQKYYADLTTVTTDTADFTNIARDSSNHTITLTLIGSTSNHPYFRSAAWSVLQRVGSAFTTVMQNQLNSELKITSAWRDWQECKDPQYESHETGFAVDIQYPYQNMAVQGPGGYTTGGGDDLQWLDNLLNILVENGAIEILTNYVDAANDTLKIYSSADIKTNVVGHLNHVHCMLAFPTS